MKRITLAFVLAFITLTLSAQKPIQVKYQGAKPTVADFAWAILSAPVDEDDCIDEMTNAVKQAWIRNRDGLPQEEGVTITIDSKNGFVLYEWKDGQQMQKVEICYWNETDGKHKLIAWNAVSFFDGRYSPGQYDALVFYRYDNTSKKMSLFHNPGFEVEYGTEDGAWISYALPRSGKDITVSYWYENANTKQKVLKWNGSGFGF